MKKQVLFLVVGVSLISLNSLSFAETFNRSAGVKVRTIVGTVESVNAAKSVALIKDKDTPKYETVRVDSDQIASLQVGQTVTAVAWGEGIPAIRK